MSDESIPQDLPGNGLSPTTPEQPLDIPLPQGLSEFEKGLFREGGPLAFDLEQSTVNLQEQIRQEGKPTGYLLVKFLWQERFAGQIPQKWADDEKVLDDIENVTKSHEQLSEPLVDALVSHPNRYLVFETATKMRLNPQQLAWALARQDFAHPVDQDIYADLLLNAQKKLGMNNDQMREAQTRAQNYIDKSYTVRKLQIPAFNSVLKLVSKDLESDPPIRNRLELLDRIGELPKHLIPPTFWSEQE